MAMRDLVPWSRGRDVSVRRGEESPGNKGTRSAITGDATIYL